MDERRILGCSKVSGFTEKTLKTWSVMLTAISLLGLIQIMIFSSVPDKTGCAGGGTGGGNG